MLNYFYVLSHFIPLRALEASATILIVLEQKTNLLILTRLMNDHNKIWDNANLIPGPHSCVLIFKRQNIFTLQLMHLGQRDMRVIEAGETGWKSGIGCREPDQRGEGAGSCHGAWELTYCLEKREILVSKYPIFLSLKFGIS